MNIMGNYSLWIRIGRGETEISRSTASDFEKIIEAMGTTYCEENTVVKSRK